MFPYICEVKWCKQVRTNYMIFPYFQVMCDHNMKFADFVAQFPGSDYDSFVLRMSHLHADAECGVLSDFIVFGNSRYPLKTWLMTPHATNENEGQACFNRVHRNRQSAVEDSIGL